MGTLVLVRHGQASFHEEDYDKLSPLGEQQARLLGDYWVKHDTQFDRIVTGPLKRQQRSAELTAEVCAAAGRPLPPIEVVDALAEMPAEQLAKRFMPQLCAEDEEALTHVQQFMATQDKRQREKLFQKPFEKMMRHWANRVYHDDAIETFQAFVDRVKGGILGLTNGERNGQRIAVFTSGGPTAVAVHVALGTTFDATMELVWQVRNASITEFIFTQGRFTLSAFNNVAHLTDPDMWTYR